MSLTFKLSAVFDEERIPREKVVMHITYGEIIRVEDDFMFRYNNNMAIPLSNRSYSCKGFKTVYTRKLDEHGRPTKLVRCADAYCVMPSCYIPFKSGLKVKGYIVKEDGIDKFLLKGNEV